MLIEKKKYLLVFKLSQRKTNDMIIEFCRSANILMNIFFLYIFGVTDAVRRDDEYITESFQLWTHNKYYTFTH